MSDKKPLCIMIAGPNGSGKSSTTREYQDGNPDFPKLYINADDIKKKFELTDQAAQLKADELRAAALSRGESFAFETVMSHPSKIDVLRHAKEKGYETRLLFITTQDPEINKLRVALRVADGGHDVPAAKIEPRYNRSMALLPLALMYADRAKVFNNTFEDPRLIFEKSPEIGEKKYPQPPPSKWSEASIARTTQASKAAIEEYHRHMAVEKLAGRAASPETPAPGPGFDRC